MISWDFASPVHPQSQTLLTGRCPRYFYAVRWIGEAYYLFVNGRFMHCTRSLPRLGARAGEIAAAETYVERVQARATEIVAAPRQLRLL